MTKLAMALLAVACLPLAAGCGNDSPGADHEIRIETARFFPKDPDLRPGETVRWYNTLPKSAENVRTVTSGTGPDDPDAGKLFDVTLQGYEGKNFDDFTYKFTDRGTYPYFTRLPQGGEYGGTVTVR